jgi:uncharacterized protein
MLFFAYSRAHVGAGDAAARLIEEHWAYMDQFADRMIARGPVLGPDREAWMGSLHVLDLPGPAAAREFVAAEPFNRAGLFEEHLIRRFADRLGRTMWDFPGGADEPRFLVISRHELVPPPEQFVILHGDLLSLDEAAPAGSALAVQGPTRDALADLFRPSSADISDWDFGGRR